MSSRTMWFIESTRERALEIRDDEGLAAESKRAMLLYYAAQLDGASVVIEGQPEFFRSCCDLRNEIKEWRDAVV